MSTSDLSFSNDPYERFLQQDKYQHNLIEMDKSSKFSKKVNKMKHAISSAKVNMLNGAMMGFMVGGLFGLVVGIYSAIQTRRLIAIPMSVIVSGGSFAFILGCGSVLRSDTLLSQSDKLLNKQNVQSQLTEDEWLKVYQFNQEVQGHRSEYF